MPAVSVTATLKAWNATITNIRLSGSSTIVQVTFINPATTPVLPTAGPYPSRGSIVYPRPCSEIRRFVVNEFTIVSLADLQNQALNFVTSFTNTENLPASLPPVGSLLSDPAPAAGPTPEQQFASSVQTLQQMQVAINLGVMQNTNPAYVTQLSLVETALAANPTWIENF